VSFSLDFSETLPSAATPRPIDRIEDRGLFQSADTISRAVFREVSLQLRTWSSFPAQIPLVLALLVSLALSLLVSLQRSWCADLSLTFAYTNGSSFL
jgi:hypothetical protein